MTKRGMEQLSVSYKIYHKLKISLEWGLLNTTFTSKEGCLFKATIDCGFWIFSKSATMISPLQFLITTPIPVSLDSLNIAPSKFVLYEFSGRGFHFLLTLLYVRGWLYSRLQISDIVFSVSSNFVQRHRVFLQLRLVSMVPNCLSRDSKKCQSLRLFPYFF